ncbi:hypothetical protein ACFWIZ_33120, partial [Streptomyces sp. NPDC127044]
GDPVFELRLLIVRQRSESKRKLTVRSPSLPRACAELTPGAGQSNTPIPVTAKSMRSIPKSSWELRSVATVSGRRVSPVWKTPGRSFGK